MSGDLQAIDPPMVESSADKTEFDLVVATVSLPDGLSADCTDVVVRQGHSERLILDIKAHSENIVTLSSVRLPSIDEVISVLA